MIRLPLNGLRCAGCGAPAAAVAVEVAVTLGGATLVGNVVEPCRCVLNVRNLTTDGDHSDVRADAVADRTIGAN